jgi:hypothetical protein
MGSEILLEHAEVETVFDLNDPFVQRTSCILTGTCKKEERRTSQPYLSIRAIHVEY